MMINLNQLRFECLYQPLYSTDLTTSDYWHFEGNKKTLQEKKFGWYIEVVAESESYSEIEDKSVYKKGIEKLEERWSHS